MYANRTGLCSRVAIVLCLIGSAQFSGCWDNDQERSQSKDVHTLEVIKSLKKKWSAT
jgi:hypothetical protein